MLIKQLLQVKKKLFSTIIYQHLANANLIYTILISSAQYYLHSILIFICFKILSCLKLNLYFCLFIMNKNKTFIHSVGWNNIHFESVMCVFKIIILSIFFTSMKDDIKTVGSKGVVSDPHKFSLVPNRDKKCAYTMYSEFFAEQIHIVNHC